MSPSRPPLPADTAPPLGNRQLHWLLGSNASFVLALHGQMVVRSWIVFELTGAPAAMAPVIPAARAGGSPSRRRAGAAPLVPVLLRALRARRLAGELPPLALRTRSCTSSVRRHETEEDSP